MKQIKLTQNKVAIVDDEDYEYLNRFKWCANKRGNRFYAVRNSPMVNGKRTLILMHRVILGLSDPNIFCDHRDMNGLNNSRSNLRAATCSQNNYNIPSRKNSFSKYKGVCLFKGRNKWKAQIMKDSKQIHLGLFKKEEEAAIAYNNAALRLHGSFANLNVIR